MTKVVLDASAVLAVLGDEPGAERVVRVLDDALICAVNVAEVIGKLTERGGDLSVIREALRTLGLNVVDFDLLLAERTGAMRIATKSRGLSLGDRACLALAEREGLPALTGDQRWVGAVPRIVIELIR